MDQLQDRPYTVSATPAGESVTNAERPACGYARQQKLLHWIVALLVLAQLAAGVWIGTMAREGHEALLRKLLYAHLANGTLIFGLTAWRLSLRRSLGVPAPPPGTPVDATALALANHGAFYAILLALPVLGWLTYLSPRGPTHAVLAATHAGTALALALAICAHLAGVAYHSFIRHDGLLKRMLP
jgi:cytochrome b561